MFEKMCARCLDDATFLGDCVSPDGRTYKLYQCLYCGSFNRVFDVPQTEKEVVLVALVTDALSDKDDQRHQMQMFLTEPRVWY